MENWDTDVLVLVWRWLSCQGTDSACSSPILPVFRVLVSFHSGSQVCCEQDRCYLGRHLSSQKCHFYLCGLGLSYFTPAYLVSTSTKCE